MELAARCTAGWRTADWLTAATWAIVVGFASVEMTVLDRSDRVHRTRRRSEARTAAAMGGGALVVGIVYGAVFGSLWRLTAPFAPEGLALFWQRRPLLAVLCAFVAWDFSGWIYHQIGHRTALGRAAHSPHHSGSFFDASLALRLTWMPWYGLLHHPLLALAGFRLELILGCLAVSNLAQALQHSASLPPAPRWLAAVVMTPGAHRHHHGPHGAQRNLGPVLTIWDRLAGTWCAPWVDPCAREPRRPAAELTARSPSRRDVPGRDRPRRDVPRRGAVHIQLAGWRRLWARQVGRDGARAVHHR